jgi:hypothetical protein
MNKKEYADVEKSTHCIFDKQLECKIVCNCLAYGCQRFPEKVYAEPKGEGEKELR